MKYPLIESTIDIHWYGWSVRFWRNEEKIYGFHNEAEEFRKDIVRRLEELRSPIYTDTLSLIEEFAKLPRVNAVQIMDNHGIGLVIYTVPFCEKCSSK